MDRSQLKTHKKICAQASREARQAVRAKGSLASAKDWRARWAAREQARLAHLADACARGVPYAAVEAVTLEPPSSLGIALMVDGADLDRVLAWLAVPPTDAMLAAREAARQARLRAGVVARQKALAARQAAAG